jgi:hypothetical protein
MKSPPVSRSVTYSIELHDNYGAMRRGTYLVPNQVDPAMAEKLIALKVASKVMPRMQTKHASPSSAPV